MVWYLLVKGFQPIDKKNKINSYICLQEAAHNLQFQCAESFPLFLDMLLLGEKR